MEIGICQECGEPMWIDDSGVSTHGVPEDPNYAHDGDQNANHVAVLDRSIVSSPENRTDAWWITRIEKLAIRDVKTSYGLVCGTICIERRSGRNMPVSWAITYNAVVLNNEGEWEYEDMPSSRSDEFLARTRWNDFEAALEAATAARLPFEK